VGTTASGLKNPATEIMPIVLYLAQRGKIHQIHMRNIRGGLNNFYEVFPDEGEMDFFNSRLCGSCGTHSSQAQSAPITCQPL
jgi:mannonate dehydratase